MTPAELYYFICKCLVMDDDAQGKRLVEAEVSSGNVSWEEFIWTGSSHLVLPALYSAFSRNGLLPLLPADLVDHLSAIYNINLHRNRQIIEQSHELIRLLNNEGIEPVFLKGVGHLLQNLYHDAGDRIMSDIDILIPEEDIQKAANALYYAGYFHPEEFKDDDFENHHHLPGFEHKSYIAMVELHHSVFPVNYLNILSNTEIYSDRKKTEGFNAWVLSTDHQMVLNFVHNELVDDGFRYKTMVIKSLYDFYLLAKLDPQKTEGISVLGYNLKFNTYCSHASVSFNNTNYINFITNRSTRIFKVQFDYLLDHPKLYELYQFIVLYRLRIFIILKSFITAPFSRHSRHYIKKKIGNPDSARRYFQKLRNEI